MTNKKSIKEWAPDDQPREKMIAKGKTALSNAELLAILLRIGKEGMSAVDVARALLDSVDNDLIKLSNLTNTTASERLKPSPSWRPSSSANAVAPLRPTCPPK